MMIIVILKIMIPETFLNHDLFHEKQNFVE